MALMVMQIAAAAALGWMIGTLLGVAIQILIWRFLADNK